MNIRGVFFAAFLAGSFLWVHASEAEAAATIQIANSTPWVAIVQRVTPAITVIETEKGLGSGFFVYANGTFVTNYHVIAGATGIVVKLSNGETYRRAYVLSTDEFRDIAILRVEATNIPVLELGNSNESMPGEDVLLIGAPRGLEQTVSNGIVSGIRVLDDGNKVIQTTAAASPGNSGGPLMNRAGQVMGILTWSVVSGQNLNFAIPINYVKGMLDALSLAGASSAPVLVLDSTRELKPAGGPAVITSSLRQAYTNCGKYPEIFVFFKPGFPDCCAAKLACFETVDVIETLGSFVRVRTKENKEGYVNSIFLGRIN